MACNEETRNTKKKKEIGIKYKGFFIPFLLPSSHPFRVFRVFRGFLLRPPQLTYACGLAASASLTAATICRRRTSVTARSARTLRSNSIWALVSPLMNAV